MRWNEHFIAFDYVVLQGLLLHGGGSIRSAGIKNDKRDGDLHVMAIVWRGEKILEVG